MGRLEVGVFWKKVNCLVPFYAEDGGNYTKIHLEKGNMLVDKRKTKTVLKDIARFFAVDLKSVKENYGAAVNRKKFIPIPFHPNLIMLSVKVREPEQKDQGSIAYLNSEKIASFIALDDQLPYKSEIFFRDNSSIKTIQNLNTIKALLKDSDIVKSGYLDLYQIRKGDNLILNESLSNFLNFIQKNF